MTQRRKNTHTNLHTQVPYQPRHLCLHTVHWCDFFNQNSSLINILPTACATGMPEVRQPERPNIRLTDQASHCEWGGGRVVWLCPNPGPNPLKSVLHSALHSSLLTALTASPSEVKGQRSHMRLCGQSDTVTDRGVALSSTPHPTPKLLWN